MITQVLTDNEIAKLAPSVFAEQAHPRMTSKYRHVPTFEVLSALRSEGFAPVQAFQSKTRRARVDNTNFTRHVIRFRHEDMLATATKNIGDSVPEVVLTNSHNGASCYSLMFGIFRLVCSNGMIVQDSSLGALHLRHKGDDGFTKEVIEGSFKVVSSLEHVSERIERFKGVTLDSKRQLEFAEQAYALRKNPAVQANPSEFLVARRPEDAAAKFGRRSLWLTLNAVQENMMRGGVTGVDRRGRNRAWREITSVSDNLRINQGLWELADSFAA